MRVCERDTFDARSYHPVPFMCGERCAGGGVGCVAVCVCVGVHTERERVQKWVAASDDRARGSRELSDRGTVR